MRSICTPTEELRALLVEILGDTERLDKIRVEVDRVSRTVTITYEDIDHEDFRDVLITGTNWIPSTGRRT